MALSDLDPDSSVGINPLQSYGSTIGVALGVKTTMAGNVYDPARVELFKNLVHYKLTHPGDADPIKVFIKPEAHKLSKIAEGRWRLISAVSAVDTMVDRILFGRFCRNLVAKTTLTPLMVGWSPLNSGHRFIHDKFRGKQTRGLDKTAWDWTVRPWLLHAVREIILSLLEGHTPGFKAMVESRWRSLFRDAVLQFADGTQVQQPGWGVMKSGCYLTIVLNSIGQLVYHALALKHIQRPLDYVKFVVIGDDVTVEDFPEFAEYEKWILDNGALLKPSHPTKHVEFAGFVFTTEDGVDKCWPEYWRKHIYMMSHSQLEVAQFMSSYCILYAMEPNFGEYIRWIMARECPDQLMDRHGCKSVWG